jgi:hypothetical protein
VEGVSYILYRGDPFYFFPHLFMEKNTSQKQYTSDKEARATSQNTRQESDLGDEETRRDEDMGRDESTADNDMKM